MARLEWTSKSLREEERASIEDFVVKNADKFVGDVLDYGCGNQPYQPVVVSVGASYHPYDRFGYPASVVKADVGESAPLARRGYWDAILCTQILQYISDPRQLLRDFHAALTPGGWLVLTGPTNWPEVELADVWRFTVSGVGWMLASAGYEEIEVSSRRAILINDIGLSLGFGAVARRPPEGGKKAKKKPKPKSK